MARAAAPSPSAAFVRWVEVQTTSDKGRKEIHYFLKRKDGTADLAVIGKEKSLRRISFRYSSGVMAGTHSLTLLKLKSRKEVVDWLNSMVSDSTSLRSSASPTSPLDDTECWQFDTKKLKDSQLQKLGHCTKEFLWLGSAWTCRKRRKHFESFLRNGVKISIHDFVFVLAEKHRRLVAYLEDMYEDPRGNKMVVVRWFHKIDEVGIVLPHNFNDREIFFSLWLQDINIECIDGSAAVLDPQHYEKFLNDAADTQLVPFVCHRQYDNGALKPFDITHVKGYWEQEVLRYMYKSSTSDASMKPLSSDDGFVINEKVNNPVVRSRNRPQQLSNGDDFFSENVGKKRGLEASYACGSGKDSNDACESASLCGKDLILPNLLEHLVVGAHVEVLCQDSGLRGCWYRAIVAKKHKDKVKVRYQDIQDAENEANCLEEWLLASRVAISDGLKLRFFGRRIIRPSPQFLKSKVSWVIDVGCVVDVWWHDGWWEGVVIHKESEERYHVYFPGEKLKSVFGRDDLRHSQEWLGNRWEHVRGRPDVVNLILSSLEETKISIGGEDAKSPEAGGAHQLAEVAMDTDKDNLFFTDVNKCNRLLLNTADDKGSKLPVDLSKDHILGQLKWNPLRKRKRGSGGYMQKSNARITGSLRKPRVVGSRTCDGFLIPKSLKVDHENCKYIGDSPFSSSVVPTLTNLVMSQ